MNPYKKSAQLLLRLIAFGFILIGGLNLAIYLFKYIRGAVDAGKLSLVWHCFYLSIAPAIGIGLWIKSPAIATRITEDFDE